MLLSFGYAGTARMDQALAQARHATGLYRDDHIWDWRVQEAQGQIQAWAGDRDGALATLRTMPPRGLTNPAVMKLDPLWDPLRDDPRFQKLLESGAP